uniref:Jmj4 protein n=1 Tax=Melanopsichium pennsylvanicum 4 TaxID=1398559 RepID=A0A077R636_9BASI|nr:jmj4 protein [Melanopsichium pennsylvanicum 4]
MFNVPPLPHHLDSYEGWHPSTINPKIANVDNNITPIDMWSHFISKRRPVVIDGFLNDQEWNNVLPAPTNVLSNDFPAKPKLLGNLVLQQCNLWLGNSKQGKSSGLHHDFHDNLYILLSGYKRFLLFPPSAHRYLHPTGFVDRVHHNGLIVYAPPGEFPSYLPLPGRKQRLPIRADGLVPSDAARWRTKARMRVKREIDEQAAADAGEGSRVKSQRKGKAKQTRAQELAEEALLQAQAELRICRLDEDGIDPEAVSSDEAGSDDDSNADLDHLLKALVSSNGAQTGDTSDEDQEEEDSDDEDDNDQGRRLMATLPTFMKHIGVAALAGDDAAIVKLRDYLESVANDQSASDQQESDSQRESAEDFEDQLENGLRASGEEEAGDDDNNANHSPSEAYNQYNPETSVAPRTMSSNGFSRKRRYMSGSDEEEAESSNVDREEDRSDTVESDGAREPAKRVKIASCIESIDATSEHNELNSEEADSQAQDEQSSQDDLEDLPTFAGADSGSEFGDVDEGEAELEKLLAMAQDQDADANPASDDQDNEPPSFSRIPPHILHRSLGVPDDPSQPMLKTANGKSKKHVPADEPYRLMPGCPPPIEVFLKPGQMLYLPASWYHEVTSSSSPLLHEQVDAKGQKQSASEVHMALNYWFHPPDALQFEPVEPRQASANEVHVPGLGVGLGDSALEHRGAGTGTHERPYRDAEVWDEVALAVEQQIKAAKASASQ